MQDRREQFDDYGIQCVLGIQQAPGFDSSLFYFCFKRSWHTVKQWTKILMLALFLSLAHPRPHSLNVKKSSEQLLSRNVPHCP